MRTLLLLVAVVALSLPVAAQRYSVDPRFGFGFDAVVVPPGQDMLPEGLGLGIRGRVAVPVNRDLSVAGGVGVAGFVFQGQDDASYVFTPQLSVILTLPRRDSARYLLGGFGGVIPSEGSGGPSLHLGVGWAFPLHDTSLYVEVDPALVVGSRETTVVIPLRVGVIF